MTNVSAEANKITAEPSSAVRTEYARQLADLIRRNPGIANNADIESLANMMADRDDSVRYWIAISIGYVGPRARQAVPALEKAFKEKECDHSSKNSTSAISFALTKIVGKPPKTDC
jgi:hypothetical protein